MKRLLASTLTIALGLGAIEICASAATYNFYFNNTEQGDNSTATPTVTLNGDKLKTTAEKTAGTSAPASVPAPASASSAPAVASHESTTALSPGEIAAPEFRHWRVTGGLVTKSSALGGSVNLGYFFNREFGINAYGGGLGQNFVSGNSQHFFGGAELEVVPIRISVGRIDNLIDLGALLGVSTLEADEDNWISPHAGIRMNLNLGSRWALTTTTRFNASYAMGELGIAIRL